MWKAIKSFLFSRNDDESRIERPEPVDDAAVAEELDAHGRGSADGRKSRPATDAASMTLAEVEITGYFQREAQQAASYFRNKILDLQKVAKQKSLTKFQNELRAIIPSLKAEIEAIVTTSRAQLIDARRRENELHDEYMRFRRQNKIGRLSNYPDSKIFLVAVLTGILLVEAVLNGYFFAKANEFGLVGGIGQALITAAINVAVGWLFGRFLFTQIHHCNKFRSYSAIVIVPLAFVAAVIFYNLFLGHFRDALAAAVDTGNIQYTLVGRNVLQSVLDSPLGLQNFDSWLLVMLGIIFALVAAVDGYYFNDPYPGYGRVAKRYEDARHDYMDDKNDLMDYLADLRDDELDEVEAIKNQIEAQSGLIQNVITWSRKSEEDARSYLNDLEVKCNHVLQLYRTSNTEARADAPPAYFKEKYDLLADVKVESIESVDVSRIEEQSSNVDEMLREALDTSREIHEIYTHTTDDIAKEIQEIEKS